MARAGLEPGTPRFSGAAEGYVAEKAENASGWQFPVGDEVAELGYVDMFTDMFDALDTQRQPRETLYDGYIVNAVMDASYRSAKSRRWEPVELFEWRGGETPRIGIKPEIIDGKVVQEQPDNTADSMAFLFGSESAPEVEFNFEAGRPYKVEIEAEPPVEKPASSESRKATIAATSSKRP